MLRNRLELAQCVESLRGLISTDSEIPEKGGLRHLKVLLNPGRFGLFSGRKVPRRGGNRPPFWTPVFISPKVLRALETRWGDPPEEPLPSVRIPAVAADLPDYERLEPLDHRDDELPEFPEVWDGPGPPGTGSPGANRFSGEGIWRRGPQLGRSARRGPRPSTGRVRRRGPRSRKPEGGQELRGRGVRSPTQCGEQEAGGEHRSADMCGPVSGCCF